MIFYLFKHSGSRYAADLGTCVASLTGIASFLRLIVSERPLFGAIGFDVAPYAGLSSIIALLVVNILQSQSWKGRYEREVEAANQLRRSIEDIRKDKSDLINHIQWQKSKIEELGHHCAWQKKRIEDLTAKLRDE